MITNKVQYYPSTENQYFLKARRKKKYADILITLQ